MLRRSLALGSCVVVVFTLVALRWASAERSATADAPARPGDPAARPLSPYFVVEGADPDVEALPLESTSADIDVAGVIARVVVRQTYRNRGSKPISARYVFPASTRAAVNGMKMTIGDRVISAEIKEREAARQVYDRARQEGKTASLLEQDRPNVFSMNVANILPGDEVQVELRYTEHLVPTDGDYELVYPAVVGPRYASAATDPGAAENRFVASPYTGDHAAPSYGFDLEVDVAAGMPIQSIGSPSHAVRTNLAEGRTRAAVTLDPSDDTAGNRDFVLRYRLSGSRISTGLLLHRGEEENFFLMTVQPPERPKVDLIPPREYVFIVDVSGSMSGFPLDTTRTLMRGLLGRLRPTDRFNVLLFAGGSEVFADRSALARPEAIDDAVAFVGGRRAGGGTELLPALRRALSLPHADGVSRSFVVVTDGYIAEEPEAFQTIRDRLGDANAFAFGVGRSVNRHLIEGMARAGRGQSFVVLDPAHATAAARRLREYVESPVLTDVEVRARGFDVYDVEPAAVPDVFARRPVVVYGKWRGEPTGTVEVTGVSGRGRFVSTVDVAAAANRTAHTGALPYLWARSRIAALSDFARGDANREQVIELGLRYNLLTRHTSFVAVHERVRASGDAVPVDQPLPMPAGVSNAAIGIGSGPEPPLAVVLALVLASGAAAARWRRRRARAA